MFCRTAVTLLPALMALAATPSRAAVARSSRRAKAMSAAVIDGRSFRLDDGREIRLAGIEPAPRRDKAERTAALSAIIAGQGREPALARTTRPTAMAGKRAFVFLAGSDTPVQGLLLAEGAALASTEITDKDCAAALLGGRGRGAQAAKKGTWAARPS